MATPLIRARTRQILEQRIANGSAIGSGLRRSTSKRGGVLVGGRKPKKALSGYNRFVSQYASKHNLTATEAASAIKRAKLWKAGSKTAKGRGGSKTMRKKGAGSKKKKTTGSKTKRRKTVRGGNLIDDDIIEYAIVHATGGKTIKKKRKM